MIWRELASVLVILLLALNGAGAVAQEAVADSKPAMREIQIGQEGFARIPELPDWSLPSPQFDSKVSAKGAFQTLLGESQRLVDAKSVVFVNWINRVNERAGLNSLGQYPIHFSPSFESVRLHRVVITRDGHTIDKTSSVTVKFLQRETGLEAGVYSGTVTALVLIDDLRVGDVLQVAHSKEGRNPVFGNLYSDSAHWDSEHHTNLRRVVLIHPENRVLHWEMLGDNGRAKISPQILTHRGKRALVFEEKDISALAFERNTPSDYLQDRRIQVTEFANWGQVAQWGSLLFAQNGPLPAELLAELKVWQQLGSQEEKAKAALRWVQDEIRYFSVSIGESSHRPSPPSDVVKRRFGDCKDKTMLLVTLLRELGLTASPVLVNANDLKLPARLQPTPLVFDHVLVQVEIDGQKFYLDGTRTGQRGPLLRMGFDLADAAGLVLDSQSQGLIRLKNPTLAENVYDLHEKFSLDAFGKPGKMTARAVYRGAVAELMRHALPMAPLAARQQAVLSDYERRYPGIELLGEPRFTSNDETNEFVIEATYTIPNLAIEQKGDWVMRFFPTSLNGLYSLPAQSNRRAPARVSSQAVQVSYQVDMQWPESVAAMLDPLNRRISNSFFSLELNRRFRGSSSHAQVHFRQLTDTVSAADLPKLHEEIRTLERTIGGVMFVGKDQIKKSGFLGLGRETIQDNMRKELEKTVEATSKVLAQNALRGDDLAEAYCERASAYSDLRRLDVALDDANQAVKIAPSSGLGYSCRQEVHFVAGRFEQAVQDAGKALSLGGRPRDVLHKRGWARFYLGHFEQAARDFESAHAAESKETEASYPVIWQMISLGRAGKPLPELLGKQMAAKASAAWPGPAMAMLAGHLSPEELLQKVNLLRGDEQVLTSTEAWFYIGQLHLIQGRAAQAKQAFEQVRDLNIIRYMEHAAAGFELARMK